MNSTRNPESNRDFQFIYHAVDPSAALSPSTLQEAMDTAIKRDFPVELISSDDTVLYDGNLPLIRAYSEEGEGFVVLDSEGDFKHIPLSSVHKIAAYRAGPAA